MNLKGDVVILVATIIEKCRLMGIDPLDDETVDFLLQSVEDALHEAHQIGIEAGRAGV